MATFVPVIGSGFDSIADQQRGWQGYNANVDRANLDSFSRANDARNNYFLTVAQMQRDDNLRQQQQASQADAENFRRYQFGVNNDLDKAQQDIERQKIQASDAAKAYQDSRKQALADAKDNEIAADALAGNGHFNTKDELDKALPNSTPLVRAALWEKNTQARQQIGQQYDFTGGIAKKENLKTGLTDMATALPASKDAKPAYNDSYAQKSWLPDITTALPYGIGRYNPIGAAARWLGTTAPDTSWYDARKGAMTTEAANLGRELAPIEKQGLDQNGVVLDPATGRYKPAVTPAWIQPAQTQPQAQAQPQQRLSPSPANPAARKVGVAYITPNGSAMIWTGTGWRPAA